MSIILLCLYTCVCVDVHEHVHMCSVDSMCVHACFCVCARARAHVCVHLCLSVYHLYIQVGAAISMTYVTGQPIVFVGTGQTYSDLKSLNVQSVVMGNTQLNSYSYPQSSISATVH